MIGMFKKVIVADNLAPIANVVFSKSPAELTGPEVLIGIYAFAVQIYCDFSGYSSIAQGIAKWLGFDLMWNFKMPYFAVSPSDFWKRWHISLSSWLRDYLYISMGGNRKGALATYRNLIITMTLGGLWHGARWTFIFWGIFHGIILVVYRLLGDRKTNSLSNVVPLFNRILKVLLMFHLVCIGWLFFRADNIGQVWSMFSVLFTNFKITPFALYGCGMVLFFAGPLFLYEAYIEKCKNLLLIPQSNPLLQIGIYSYQSFMLLIFPPLIAQTFIYFQF